MALPPAKIRELVFQMLFSGHFDLSLSDEGVAFFMNELKTTKKQVTSAYDYVARILKVKEKLDQKIEEASIGYALDRIASVELNILRLALYEMIYDQSIPKEVSISEAVRLAKKFSTKESCSFVNAILDHIYKNNLEKVYTP